jgi:hypothetical protein
MAGLFKNFYIEVDMPPEAPDNARAWNWRVVHKATRTLVAQDWATSREDACSEAVLAIEALPEVLAPSTQTSH